MTGKVKWFSDKKGYGFITTSEGKEVFAHFSQITADGYRSLREGDSVEFDVADSDRGPTAQKIKRV